MQDAEKFVEDVERLSYAGRCCRSDTDEPRSCPATRCPNGTDAEISPDFVHTLCSGRGSPRTRIDPLLVIARIASTVWFSAGVTRREIH